MKLFRRQPKAESINKGEELTWDPAASQAVEQALAAAPVPKMLRARIKKELRTAAENQTRAASRNRVTPEDVMASMLAKMPAHVRDQVETAMKGGPQELEKLQKKLRGQL